MNATATEASAEAGQASAPKGEIVVMLDGSGRTVEFVGKRKLLKESIFEGEGSPAVRLDFRNGETRVFPIPEALLLRFACHGAEQKLGDETAGETDVDDMTLAVDELIERLNKGEWSTRREGGGMAGTSILLKALVEYAAGKKTVEQVKAFLKGKTQAEKNALRSSDALRPIVQKLEQERDSKAAKVDTGALLSELDSSEEAAAATA